MRSPAPGCDRRRPATTTRVMSPLRIVAASLSIAAAVALPRANAAAFVDVLDTPAQMSALAQRGLLQGVAHAGERLVAVGQRGHVLVSRDGGTTWKQSPVPDRKSVCRERGEGWG